MNRLLQYVNLAGIAVLVALSFLQWKANREINLRAIDLEKTRLEQVKKIAAQEKTIRGQAADLDDLRHRVSALDSALMESDAKVRDLTTVNARLTAEQAQLKTALDQYAAAIKQRDDTIRQANDQLQQLAQQRNDAVIKFNDLAAKYNSLVKDWNQLQAKKPDTK